MLIGYKRGQGSIILRVKILDSSVATGAGKTGLSSASGGLIISTIADNESSSTVYAQGSSNIESITTLGTFAAPTSGKCRFKEIDATNHKGIYEIQIADARYAVSSAKSLLISISGATNGADCDVVIPLRDLDPYDAVRAGLTALPNAAAEAAGGLFTRGTGAGQINQEDNGYVSVNLKSIIRTVLTETSSGYLAAAFKKLFDVAAPVLTTASVNQTGDSYVRIGATGSGLTSLAPASTALTNVTWTDARATKLDNLDAAVTSRLATAGYTAPDNSSITAIKARTDNLPGDPADASDIAGLISALATGLGTPMQAGATVTLASTQPNYAPAKAGDPMSLTSGERSTLTAGVFSYAVEASESFLSALRLMRAALLGKTSGFPGSPATFRDQADSKNRITVVHDSDGNRTAVTTDAS